MAYHHEQYTTRVSTNVPRIQIHLRSDESERIENLEGCYLVNNRILADMEI